MDKRAGDSVLIAYSPGELVWPERESAILRLPLADFQKRNISGRELEPRLGRFYPQGMLRGILGVYPSTMAPCRVVSMEDDAFVVDCNHPLARLPLSLEAHLIHLEDKRSETGGRLSHWVEEICNWGPGMQATLPHAPTDFFEEAFFHRQDDGGDAAFYDEPRIVGHVDTRASSVLQGLYARHLEPGMRVLDLMSSVQSHLPQAMDLDVTGLGLNIKELQQNPVLTRHVVHDLNREPTIPMGASGYDAVVCSLSFEYLTQPVAVLKSVRNVLAPGGSVLLGVSNRWFSSKVVAGWIDLHEFERVGYMLECLRRAGFGAGLEAVSVRNEWRPPWDKHFVETRGVSDPIYVVSAKKTA
ncbi:MAG: methyltransferase domain-containing protein [Oceanidesulfovibrio sp.]